MSAETVDGWTSPERLKDGDGHSSRSEEHRPTNSTEQPDREPKTPLMQGWVDTARARKQGISDWDVYEASLLLPPNDLETLIGGSFSRRKSSAIGEKAPQEGRQGEHSDEDAIESKLSEQIEGLSDRVDTLETEDNDIEVEQIVANRVQQRIDTTLHAPITLGGGLAIIALSIGLLTSGSIFSAPVFALGVFMILAFRRIKSNHRMAVRDVI